MFAVGYSTERDYESALVAALRERLRPRLARLAEAGVLPAPADLADALAAAVPDAAPHPAALAIGPMFTSTGAMRRLGVGTKQALASRRAHESVLAMKTADGLWVYPAYQFADRSGLRPGFVAVLRALRGVDRWSAALWLATPHDDLAGLRPVDALAEHDPATVARLASHYRTALAA